jgi:hypothetical protein
VSRRRPDQPPSGGLARLFHTQRREAQHVVSELVAVRGLMPLLMKSRNGDAWTAADKAELLAGLRRLSRLSPYLLFLLLPGSALLLPIYAWWLDRRRTARRPTPLPAESPSAPLPDSQRL